MNVKEMMELLSGIPEETEIFLTQNGELEFSDIEIKVVKEKSTDDTIGVVISPCLSDEYQRLMENN